jgi:hypothetical protein
VRGKRKRARGKEKEKKKRGKGRKKEKGGEIIFYSIQCRRKRILF